MNKTVELVKMWSKFEEQYPKGSIEDFFRRSLAQKAIAEKNDAARKLIPDINGKLIILLRRIGKFHMAYSNKALEVTDLSQIEEFGILVTIYNERNPIKSEAIHNNIIELSSGSNMLIRMKKKGLVREYDDDQDKRVKRLKLTVKGEKTLMKAKDLVIKVADMMLYDMSDEDKRLCLQLLKPVNTRFSGMYQQQKNKRFEDIYRENIS